MLFFLLSILFTFVPCDNVASGVQLPLHLVLFHSHNAHLFTTLEHA